tara:strand:+ start:19735 stop:23118 length:3384 start_codon:yes stop_codon:yes gene_type:complete
MFRLYHSNDLDVLKELLVHEIRQNPAGLFEQETLLVQSQGMAHWLRLQLADGLGIAAQLDFPLPSAYVWRVFNTLKPDLPERSHFDKQAMAWKLMRLLPQLKNQPACEALAHYLEDDRHGLRCYELAHKIADVFDQYLVYRPDWLLSWEQGSDDAEGADVRLHPWQPVVWRALVDDSRRLGHSLDHRARLTLSLEEIVAAQGQRLSALPKRLFVFGIAALPGSYWDVLNAISPHIDVHFFLLNPCRNYWGDIVSDQQRARIISRTPDAAAYLDSGNPLLASWGRLGRDFLTLVHDTAAEGGLQDIEAWTEVPRDHLLGHLKADLLELQDGRAGAYRPESLTNSHFKKPVGPGDDSLRFVAAHSPLREVQRLHDQLLHWFSTIPGLKPRDVVVMVPDIDQYAPYIDAVFASAPDDQRIPWAIADQSQVQENPLLDSLLGLMSLFDNRLQLTDVLDWLDVPAIRRRFGMDDNDLGELRRWLDKAAIRWGLDDEHRSELGFPAFDQNSWRKGLRQLLLGLLLPQDDQLHWQDDWPVFAVEGAAAEQLGQLLALADTLEKWQTFQSEPHTPEVWMAAIPELLDDFCDADLDEAVQLQRVRDALGRWHDELRDADFSGDLSPQVVRNWFREYLTAQGGWQRFLAGPVNFCTLMPMRSIPFRAVCLLGMNDQDYPRQVVPVGFDLIASGKARRGDRSRREDDRYLVLEALCSAQDKLYVSYRGRDVRENHELQPSVLISELLDYVSDSYCLAGDEDLPGKDSRARLRQWLTEELPLQPFSRSSYSADGQRRVPSHHRLWAGVVNAAQQPLSERPFFDRALPMPDEFDASQVLWEDVKASLLKPADFFMKRRLRLSPELYADEARDEETFIPDNLENSQLRTRWLADQVAGHGDLGTYVQREQALGHLPVSGLGELQAEAISSQLQPLSDVLLKLCHGEPASGTARLTLQVPGPELSGESRELSCILSGEYHGVWQGLLVQSRSSDIRGEHLLGLWLDLVLLAAAEPGRVQGAVIVGGKKELQEFSFAAPDQAAAQDYLRQCLQHYWRSWQAPQTPLPGLLWALLNTPEDKRQRVLDKEMASDYSALNRTATLRCLPDLSLQLMQDVDGWLEQHEWLFALPRQCLQDSAAEVAS